MSLNILKLAEEITTEQFEELIARVCLKDAVASMNDPASDVSDDLVADLTDMANFIFYEGMNGESNVAKNIDKFKNEYTPLITRAPDKRNPR